MGCCEEINEILRIGQALWAAISGTRVGLCGEEASPNKAEVTSGLLGGGWLWVLKTGCGLVGAEVGGGTGDTSAGCCCPSASNPPEVKRLCHLKARAGFLFFISFGMHRKWGDLPKHPV